MRKPLVLALLLAVLLAAGAAGADDTPLRLATTTSTYETGLLDHILPPFEARHGVKVHVISVGTGKAMEIARSGDVDVILVHARPAEDRFVAEGYGVNRRDVMYNDFLLVGPAADPAGAKGSTSAAAALARVMAAGQPFVSRGDESGTHQKERALWAASGLSPQGPWYLEAGQGMGAALRMADEKAAYCLVDRATWLSTRHDLQLRALVEGGPELANPYGIIAVSPYRYPHVQYDRAMALIAWVTSPECQTLIGDFRQEGEPLFHPDAAAPRP
ncbi:MAG: substrate-binding domain-containing protein [Gemmatimonadota bacterium]